MNPIRKFNTTKSLTMNCSRLLLFVCFLIGMAQPAASHSNPGYSHDSYIGTHNANWMAKLPGHLRLSELSLPGTHDSMAIDGAWAFDGAQASASLAALAVGQVLGPLGALLGIITYETANDIISTQSMSLYRQLRSGIRVLDIRARHIENRFDIHHGPAYLGKNFDDVMIDVSDFLDAHPNEMILMRVKNEHTMKDNTRSFFDTFESYMQDYGDYVWQPIDTNDNNPRLARVRGKVVIIDEFTCDVYIRRKILRKVVKMRN